MDHGRVQTEWVQGKRLEMGSRSADGAGARERLEMGWEKGRWARMCADSVVATEKLEMGREKDRWA